MDGNETADLQVLTEVLTALKKLDHESQERMIQTVCTFLKLSPASKAHQSHPQATSSTGSSARPGSFSEDRSMSAKDFMMDKQPRTDVERVVCLAYYLTHYANTPHFQTVDISKLNTEAAQIKFSNATVSVNNAIQGGYLAPASHGKKQISAAGERFVQALPDRDAARKVMDNVRPRRATRKSSAQQSES
jgi:hypothetical protein